MTEHHTAEEAWPKEAPISVYHLSVISTIADAQANAELPLELLNLIAGLSDLELIALQNEANRIGDRATFRAVLKELGHRQRKYYEEKRAHR